jgi:hypothetical protein
MRYLSQALAYWPAFLLAALWLVAGLVALRYASSTRRPIFLWGGLAALLLAVERMLSPMRFLLHYLSTHTFYGGGNVATIRIEFLFGAYKYEWVVDGLAVLSFLLGLLLEVRRARRRAIRNAAAQAAGPAAMDDPATAFPAAGNGYAQPQPAQPTPADRFGAPTQPTFAPPLAGSGFSAPGPQAPADDQPTLYQRPPTGPGVSY